MRHMVTTENLKGNKSQVLLHSAMKKHRRSRGSWEQVPQGFDLGPSTLVLSMVKGPNNSFLPDSVF